MPGPSLKEYATFLHNRYPKLEVKYKEIRKPIVQRVLAIPAQVGSV